MTIARPVQLGMMDAADKGVGPILQSVIYGQNADLIASVAPLYLTGSVLDVTYGRGMWWRRFTPDPFTFHDLALDGVDFRQLPHADRSFGTVCFDPPYVPRTGRVDATVPRDQDFRERFGLAEARATGAMEELIDAGLEECARVFDRWLLVKCNDFVNGRAFYVGSVRILNVAERLGLVCHDLIVHASGSGPGGGQDPHREARPARALLPARVPPRRRAWRRPRPGTADQGAAMSETRLTGQTARATARPDDGLCQVEDIAPTEGECPRVARWEWTPEPDAHPVLLCNFHAEPLLPTVNYTDAAARFIREGTR